MELIISQHPGAGNIITLAQFAFIALEGFLISTKFCTRRRHVPLKDYLILVIMFFLVSVSNNYALGFSISMPLHMIFKSGSLVSNMVLGVLLLKKEYSLTKYLSVGMISAGIAICTIASTMDSGKYDAKNGSSTSLLGIGLLTFSLIGSSRMGIKQETLFKKYGKHPREALFYCHALPLPAFLMLYSDIRSHAIAFSGSPQIDLSLYFTETSMPIMWFYLMIIAAAQYVCARSVFTLTTECSSLTVTLVITLRKFMSLVISIVYFQNPFTMYHWIGAILVFIGTFMFVEIFPGNKSSVHVKKD
ncbi:UDP-xylose and UDP-N-acetylglucosamine transporter [Halotydeus destructor]|nr:UDP-xylose and UDP-N-acetylglucosamine transporter [Halotydeus destructor]